MPIFHGFGLGICIHVPLVIGMKSILIPKLSTTNLNKFLKSSPKYAGMACGLVGAAMMVPIAAAPIVGGIAATYLAAAKKVKETGDESFLKEDVTRYLQEEIERRNQSINQKLHTIEQIQREIANDQQQITECNFVLGQLESEE